MDTSNWISLGESIILVLTIIVMIYQARQIEKHHREDNKLIINTFRSQIHEGILCKLHELNRMLLEYPEDIRSVFEGFKQSSVEEIRRYCYVYTILDLLNYMVLHKEVVDPFLEKHLRNLASLFHEEQNMKEIYEEVKTHQSKTLIEYIESLKEK